MVVACVVVVTLIVVVIGIVGPIVIVGGGVSGLDRKALMRLSAILTVK